MQAVEPLRHGIALRAPPSETVSDSHRLLERVGRPLGLRAPRPPAPRGVEGHRNDEVARRRSPPEALRTARALPAVEEARQLRVDGDDLGDLRLVPLAEG